MEHRQNLDSLTERQKREVEYHAHHAILYADKARQRPTDVIKSPERRWWNAYWEMFHHLRELNLRGKKVLVFGCGFGHDAIRLALMGADVEAFDLSPDSLKVAMDAAAEAGVNIPFQQMAGENLTYDDGVFDLVLMVDILHHCEIDKCLQEISRVAKPGCNLVINEIYTHSLLDAIRNSHLVSNVLYPRLVKFVYEGKPPYITQDERKITEKDLRRILRVIEPKRVDYYYIFTKRVIPATYVTIAKLDRCMAMLLRPIAGWISGRVMVTGNLSTERKSV